MSSEERTYLELSEEGDGSHKFYEVVVKGKELTIRYGRIGDAGQTSTKKFSTPDAARAEATKKIGEKTRKGYAPAVMGEREKRPVRRRSVASRPSTSKPAPVLWKFDSGSTAFGIFIDDKRCWVGNEDGRVFALNHQGKVLMQYRFPNGVKCLVGDDAWVYAGCDDGNVYDLTGKVPRLAYQIAEDLMLLWLDIWNGHLAVSGDDGWVTVFSPEEELLWKKKSKGDDGWMVRCDQMATYHGHSKGVTAYRMSDGKVIWDQPKGGDILFGWQTPEAVYPGTVSGHVRAIDKFTGTVGAVCKCDEAVLSNASSPDGAYIFAADSGSSIYCFDAKGNRLWKMGTTCDSALSMQYHQGKLYLVTTDGILACLDASETAIQAAEAGTLPRSKEIKAPKTVAVAETTQLETTRDESKGVVVECVAEGSKLRVRVTSRGYKKDWNVQFPRNLRVAGARYLVDEVREATQGGFYRAYGNIRKLQGAAPRGRSTRRR